MEVGCGSHEGLGEKGSRQGYWILTKKGEDGEALDDCWESLVLALHVV